MTGDDAMRRYREGMAGILKKAKEDEILSEFFSTAGRELENVYTQNIFGHSAQDILNYDSVKLEDISTVIWDTLISFLIYTDDENQDEKFPGLILPDSIDNPREILDIDDQVKSSFVSRILNLTLDGFDNTIKALIFEQRGIIVNFAVDGHYVRLRIPLVEGWSIQPTIYDESNVHLQVITSVSSEE
jgi:hypothetical protein